MDAAGELAVIATMKQGTGSPSTGSCLEGGPLLRGGLFALLLALSACAGSESAKTQEELSLACEMRKCDCAPDNSPFKAGKPLLWQLDGSAYCPKGYHLRLLDLPPSSKMVT
ncbi:MAG TPA: hypothetical protein VFA23_12415 [Dongiaceae bacterium]|nr:hypothetical protein [Dongiaceae bacterium]